MDRDAAHEDDEDEKRKRHRFKRVPTRNGEASALIYTDLASRCLEHKCSRLASRISINDISITCITHRTLMLCHRHRKHMSNQHVTNKSHMGCVHA